MENDKDNIIELAALNALNAIDGEDAREFERLLAKSAEARCEAEAFAAVAAALAKSPIPFLPPAELKEKILRQVEQQKTRANAEAQLRKLAPRSQDGFASLKNAGETGWLPLRTPGAFVKLLSFDETSGHAVVLGKLEAGGRYPAHHHRNAEDLFMLSGDLHIGEEIMRAGDFHHAEAGSTHGVNWSEQGCILLAVLAKEDLLAQFSAAT